MTLSPAAIGENYISPAQITPILHKTWYYSTSLGAFKSGTRAVAVKTYCQKHNIKISLCPTSTSQELTFTPTDIFRAVLSFKYTVVEIDACNKNTLRCKILHTKHDVITRLSTQQNSGTAESTCVQYATITVPRNHCTSVQISCDRSRGNHSPLTTSIRKTALDNSDPGLDLYYQTVEKNTHIAVIQDKETGAFRCIYPRCKKTFKTLNEWRHHYKYRFPIPGQFARADFTTGKLVLATNQPFRPYHKKKTGVTIPLLYRSLMDKDRGKEMRAHLYKRLQALQPKRSF